MMQSTSFPFARTGAGTRVAGALVTALLLGLAGCDNRGGATGGGAPTTAPAAPDAARGGIGVLDYDRLFNELGWTDEINASMQRTNTTLAQRVEAFQNEINAALEQTRNRLFDAAKLSKKQREDFANGRELEKLPFTPQQKDELVRSLSNANTFLQRAGAQAQQMSRERESQLVGIYRDSAQPSVRRVAEAAGLSVVATPAQVVYFANSADITNKVIDDLRLAPPPRKVPDAPTLELPKIQLSAPSPPPATAPSTALPPAPAQRPR